MPSALPTIAQHEGHGHMPAFVLFRFEIQELRSELLMDAAGSGQEGGGSGSEEHAASPKASGGSHSCLGGKLAIQGEEQFGEPRAAQILEHAHNAVSQ